MSQDLISFGCPNCDVQLRVPVSMAGIKGPCPACSSPIQAPLLQGGHPAHQAQNQIPSSYPDQLPANLEPQALTPPQTAPSRFPVPATSHGEVAAPFPESPPAEPTPAMELPALASGQTEPELEGALTSPSPQPKSRPLSDLSAPAAPAAPTGPLPNLWTNDPLQAPARQDAPAPAGFPETSVLSALLATPSPATAPPEIESPDSLSSPGIPLAEAQTPIPNPPDNDPVAMGLQPGLSSFSPPETSPSYPGEPLSKPFPSLDTFPVAPPPEPQFPAADQSPTPPDLGDASPSSLSGDPTGSALPDFSHPDSRSLQGDPVPETSAPPTGFTPAPDPNELDPENILPLHSDSPSFPEDEVREQRECAAAIPERNERRHLHWTAIVFPFLFLLLAGIMVYLVLDLSDFLPHSKSYQRLPELPGNKPEAVQVYAPKRNPPSPVAPIEHQESRSVTPPQPTPPGVFKVDLQTLFPQPTPAPEPAPASEPASGLPVKPSPGELPPDISPDPKPKGPLIEERDRKVEGEVNLPPLIDLNPSRNALPEKNDKPSKSGEALTRFLSASTLAERRPYMTESRRSEAELARSPLARKLPPVIRQRLLNHITDNSDKHDERFFEVSFDRDSAITPVPILVQVTEEDDDTMKVHTDAFIDLYNDEMARFGAVPIKGEHTFHAIVDAYKRCYEDNIPDSAQKSYIKLRQHEQVTPRLQAYFGKTSAIATRISQPNGLPWGRSGISTVTVKWNTDHPGRPYIELVRIDGFTWNP